MSGKKKKLHKKKNGNKPRNPLPEANQKEIILKKTLDLETGQYLYNQPVKIAILNDWFKKDFAPLPEILKKTLNSEKELQIWQIANQLIDYKTVYSITYKKKSNVSFQQLNINCKEMITFDMYPYLSSKLREYMFTYILTVEDQVLKDELKMSLRNERKNLWLSVIGNNHPSLKIINVETLTLTQLENLYQKVSYDLVLNEYKMIIDHFSPNQEVEIIKPEI
jgi:hypothetical protein